MMSKVTAVAALLALGGCVQAPDGSVDWGRTGYMWQAVGAELEGSPDYHVQQEALRLQREQNDILVNQAHIQRQQLLQQQLHQPKPMLLPIPGCPACQ